MIVIIIIVILIIIIIIIVINIIIILIIILIILLLLLLLLYQSLHSLIINLSLMNFCTLLCKNVFCNHHQVSHDYINFTVYNTFVIPYLYCLGITRLIWIINCITSYYNLYLCIALYSFVKIV